MVLGKQDVPPNSVDHVCVSVSILPAESHTVFFICVYSQYSTYVVLRPLSSCTCKIFAGENAKGLIPKMSG